MAVLQTIRNFFISAEPAETGDIVPAPICEYTIRPLTLQHIDEVLRLNIRCFKNGENYTRSTFNFLLSETRTLSYRSVTDSDEMVGFIFVMMNGEGVGHLTTIGVAPEHRRRRIAERLLVHIENALRTRGISTIMLEVRVSNTSAQNLYSRVGYAIVQRLPKYYNNGEDGFLMMKSLVV